ncbi:transposase [Foetidibacter luteolus]|uniref:transposase n=1 Tax=Foetidibacter luteolus TaxID=2608880 RepID=UPI001A998C55|nr:transposase [Foetidibacter luteolus]
MYQRKSNVNPGEIYFWTATINKWQQLLISDVYKNVIIQSLQFLSDKQKVDVFAFVIMPNHLHFIWRVNELNGKESPHASLLKFTAHTYKKMLLQHNPTGLSSYAINAPNKQYEFWQRDSLAISLFNKEIAVQKLNYLHNNPVSGKWRLAKYPYEYQYSSARYYETGEKTFPFLKNLWDEF